MLIKGFRIFWEAFRGACSFFATFVLLFMPFIILVAAVVVVLEFFKPSLNAFDAFLVGSGILGIAVFLSSFVLMMMIGLAEEFDHCEEDFC